jgi:hypothetical protein
MRSEDFTSDSRDDAADPQSGQGSVRGSGEGGRMGEELSARKRKCAPDAALPWARAEERHPCRRASVEGAFRFEPAPLAHEKIPDGPHAGAPAPGVPHSTEAVAAPTDGAGETAPAAQPWLLAYQNPLTENVGRDFFRSLPRNPGIYKMRDETGFILYVGKAKSLKNRLNSYRQANPGAVSRKVLRLLRRVRSIDTEELASEAAALIRENELLRELRPPYNSANTSPESYFFLSLRVIELPDGLREARLRLTTDPRRRNGERLFGAFKGRASVREGYFALLRMFWVSRREREERFSVPSRLLGRRIPPAMTLPLPQAWITPLKHFLQGSSDALLSRMSEDILASDSIPPFAYGMIQQDLETLRTFFDRVTRRNRLLRLRYRIPGRVIPQELIDDLIVLERHGGSRELLHLEDE